MRQKIFTTAAVLVAVAAASGSAHITPVVVLRKQADIIRETVPNAATYTVTTVKLGKADLQRIAERAHYTPNVDRVNFYMGKDASGATAGTVVFPQMDTMHGPIEVGITIDRNGKVTSVAVTRATVEMKPWILDVQQSGAMDLLKGSTVDDGPRHISDRLTGMPAYIADAVATATFRALVLRAILLSS